MDSRILAGIFVLLGLGGIGFAWGGFLTPPEGLSEDVMEQFQAAFEAKDFETLEALRNEYLPGHKGPFAELDEETRDGIFELREKIHGAMLSGDNETAQELRAEMQELLPEDFRGMHRGFGHNMRGRPSECPCTQTD